MSVIDLSGSDRRSGVQTSRRHEHRHRPRLFELVEELHQTWSRSSRTYTSPTVSPASRHPRCSRSPGRRGARLRRGIVTGCCRASAMITPDFRDRPLVEQDPSDVGMAGFSIFDGQHIQHCHGFSGRCLHHRDRDRPLSSDHTDGAVANVPMAATRRESGSKWKTSSRNRAK